GSIGDTMAVNEGVRLVAISDVNQGKVQAAKANLEKSHGDKVQIANEQAHVGLDGYQAILNNPTVDVVHFTTSPGFRPRHVLEAVQAGKHVFAEKPVCVDPAGWRICKEAHELAKKNGTAIVTGTQYRRQKNYVEAIDLIKQGAIGTVKGMTARYCSTGIWNRERQEGMTDAEYQINNWMHFIWLSGDQICEQAVHNVDVMTWLLGNPTTAYGSGGRFTRPEDSQMWDSMSVDYTFDAPEGERLCSFMCRQIPGTAGNADNMIYGSEGVASIKAINGGTRIVDADGKVIYRERGDIGVAYRQEHKDLIDSIRIGSPIVELQDTADASLAAVMGRVAAYTGQKISWKQITESKLDLFPKELSLDASLPNDGYAIPGRTQFV
ncbi:MAG: Gfo/Idh/MocA family oxidoreductase, partial [Phycisphaerales bacterium]|nr:Gfo/Idh/MocA family oxidoreductase [Phycisphaerales bacterium]